ncbi:MAG: DUF5723 family protein [Alistipes sp.]
MKLTNTMKQFTCIIMFLAATILTPLGVSAQMKTSYFMEESIQRLDMNPSFVPQRGYINIPAIGNIGVNYHSNFLSVKNILYPDPDGEGLVTFMHSSVDAGKFLRRMRNTNHLSIGLNENIFGFGAYARNYFWTFGLNLRSETSLSIPKEFFRLAKELHAGEYNLKGFNAESDNYLEFAFGAAVPIFDYLTVGARVKFLLGGAHASLDVESMQVNINDNEWRADMRGRFNGNITGIDFSHLAGKMPLSEVTDAIDHFKMSIGSWGLAFDLGADARLLDDRLKVSLAINDIGFLAWSKKSAVNGTFDNLSVAFRGYDFDAKDADFDRPDKVIVDVDAPRRLSRMLTATVNIGGEYTILHNAIGFGLLSQTRFYGDYTSTELTVSANFRPSSWFSASLSHSLVQNRMGVIGLALNAHPSWINFFLGVDYVGFNYGKKGIPINLKSANFYFGLAVPITHPRVGGWFVADTQKN